MLRRLIAWCVPDASLRLPVVGLEATDVERALAPYERETRADAPVASGAVVHWLHLPPTR